MLVLATYALALAGAPDLKHSRLSQSQVLRPQPAESGLASALQRLRGGSTKCDVILIGCGVPKRGMGWYHAKQMLDGDCPSADLTAVVEPWFLGPGGDSEPGKVFKEWADEMEAEHGTKFVKSVTELEIKVAAC